MDTIKNAAAVLGFILSIISLLTIFTKSGRDFFSKAFKTQAEPIQQENEQQTKDIQEIKNKLNSLTTTISAIEENSKQQCRNTIKNIYYRYQNEKEIPLYERKTVDKTYEIYSQQFHGNSYASLLYNEICQWKIKATPQDINED